MPVPPALPRASRVPHEVTLSALPFSAVRSMGGRIRVSGYLTDDLRHVVLGPLPSYVGLGDDTDTSLSAVHNGEAPDLVLLHDTRHILERRIGTDGHRWLGHAFRGNVVE